MYNLSFTLILNSSSYLTSVDATFFFFFLNSCMLLLDGNKGYGGMGECLVFMLKFRELVFDIQILSCVPIQLVGGV